METKKKLYLVMFGDSREYRVEFEDVKNVDPFHHTNPLEGVEKELTDYLRGEFPEESLAYYVTPKVTEIEWDEHDKYADYPVLDDKAVEEIKEVLKRGVEVMEQNKEENSDAPYSNIK